MNFGHPPSQEQFASVGVRRSLGEGGHTPVMAAECLQWLAPERGGFFIDATVGSGGHAEAILSASPQVQLLGVDWDPEALAQAELRLGRFGDRVMLVKADFSSLRTLCHERALPLAQGILADLGMSSLQLESADRGFSFQKSGPLDMRMNPSQPRTAWDLIQSSDAPTLARWLAEYGEERHSTRIAQAIANDIRTHRLKNDTLSLARVVRSVLRLPRGRRDPATRTFQALRIAVNHELENLDALLRDLPYLLAIGGRGVILTFHSLEDRRVKQAFRALTHTPSCFRLSTQKPIHPNRHEIRTNPRARSAKLRGIERRA